MYEHQAEHAHEGGVHHAGGRSALRFLTGPVTGSSDFNAADHDASVACQNLVDKAQAAIDADPFENCAFTAPDGKRINLRTRMKRSECETKEAENAELYEVCDCPGCDHGKIKGHGQTLLKTVCAEKNAKAPLVHTHTKEACIMPADAQHYGFLTGPVTGSSDINAADDEAGVACQNKVDEAQAAIDADPFEKCKFPHPNGSGRTVTLERRMKRSGCPAAKKAWVDDWTANNRAMCSCPKCDQVVREYSGSALAGINGAVGSTERCRIANEIAADTLRWQQCAEQGGTIENGTPNMDCANPFTACEYRSPLMNCGNPLPSG